MTTYPLFRALLPGVLLMTLLACETRSEIYAVGPGKPYPALTALPALKPGDTVEIYPGVYREMRRWRESGTAERPIRLIGVGAERPVFDGTGLDVHGAGSVPRALFQIEGDHYVIENLEFRSARNRSFNGAGIRVVGARNTAIRRCKITRCDMGIMSNANDLLNIEACEIAFNGSPEKFNGYAHNLYLEGDRTTVRGCYLHDAVAGMNFKSRGRYVELLYNYIAYSNEGELSLVDGEQTRAEHSHVVMIGNVVLSKPDRTGNNGKFIDFGQDMGGTRRGTLFLFHNTLIAGDRRIRFLQVGAPDSKIVAHNNIFIGSDLIVGENRGSVEGSHNWMPPTARIPEGVRDNRTGETPGFLMAEQEDYRITGKSACSGQGVSGLRYLDFAGKPQPGTPVSEYVPHLRLRPRPRESAPTIGAYSALPSDASGPAEAELGGGIVLLRLCRAHKPLRRCLRDACGPQQRFGVRARGGSQEQQGVGEFRQVVVVLPIDVVDRQNPLLLRQPLQRFPVQPQPLAGLLFRGERGDPASQPVHPDSERAEDDKVQQKDRADDIEGFGVSDEKLPEYRRQTDRRGDDAVEETPLRKPERQVVHSAASSGLRRVGLFRGSETILPGNASSWRTPLLRTSQASAANTPADCLRLLRSACAFLAMTIW